MMPHNGWKPISATPIEELRNPHPEQKRIDAESAALLRATALDLFRRMTPSAPGVPTATAASRLLS
jgi:hypothetical protein